MIHVQRRRPRRTARAAHNVTPRIRGDAPNDAPLDLLQHSHGVIAPDGHCLQVCWQQRQRRTAQHVMSLSHFTYGRARTVAQRSLEGVLVAVQLTRTVTVKPPQHIKARHYRGIPAQRRRGRCERTSNKGGVCGHGRLAHRIVLALVPLAADCHARTPCDDIRVDARAKADQR